MAKQVWKMWPGVYLKSCQGTLWCDPWSCHQAEGADLAHEKQIWVILQFPLFKSKQLFTQPSQNGYLSRERRICTKQGRLVGGISVNLSTNLQCEAACNCWGTHLSRGCIVAATQGWLSWFLSSLSTSVLMNKLLKGVFLEVLLDPESAQWGLGTLEFISHWTWKQGQRLCRGKVKSPLCWLQAGEGTCHAQSWLQPPSCPGIHRPRSLGLLQRELARGRWRGVWNAPR